MPNRRLNNPVQPDASPARFESLEDRRLLAAPYGVHLTAPWSHAVFQRDGNNAGYVTITGTFSGDPSRIEARAVVIGGEGKGVDGNTGYTTGWTKIAGLPTDGKFSGTLVVRAGGWYRIQVRGVGALGAGSARQVRNVGVGDVYFLAGQSNMEGASASSVSNDDHVSMAVYDWEDTTQDHGPEFAHLSGHVGPAPHGKVGPAGTLGDLLVKDQGVPVLFLQTSAASTTVEEWRDVAEGATPGSLKEYATLRSALQRFVPMLGGARAVLWHQGEEDAGDVNKTPTDEYASALSQVIAQSRIDSGLPFLPWVVARVSSVRDTEPTVIAQDLAVERGQEAVIASDPLVYPGPLTDDLERYAGNNVHYTPAAQEEHGRRWFERLKSSLFSDTPIVSIATTRRRATEGGAFARITLYRTGYTDRALTVSYMVGGRATNGVDYAPLSGSVTFNPGESFASVRIYAADDGIAEAKESVTLTLLDGAEYDLKSYDPMLPSPIGGALAPAPATNAATVVIAPSA